MIADVTVTEKSFGPKSLMTGVKFSVDVGEKVGVIGCNDGCAAAEEWVKHNIAWL